jgi:hypothetical protein
MTGLAGGDWCKWNGYEMPDAAEVWGSLEACRAAQGNELFEIGRGFDNLNCSNSNVRQHLEPLAWEWYEPSGTFFAFAEIAAEALNGVAIRRRATSWSALVPLA